VQLNRRAWDICRRMTDSADVLRIVPQKARNGTQLIDCGIHTPGGLEAGRMLAECCMAGLGHVRFLPGRGELGGWPAVQVRTDHPVAACLASQYAGWEIKNPDYFAMGSGPMRATANRETLFESIGYVEQTDIAVGVLEAGSLPPDAVSDRLAADCGVATEDLILLVARTACQAGNVQIVARSVETTLHKLVELTFDVDRIESAYGTAPLPPVARNDLDGIGRTNDAILYGAEVALWCRGDDESLSQIGPQLPSSSSTDHGKPFAEIFAHYDHDFYKIDRLLFSPAAVTLINLDTGRTARFGGTRPDLLQQSFTE